MSLAVEQSVAEPCTVAPLTATPTSSGRPLRFADFDTLVDAFDYAASGHTGMNFYSGRLDLLERLTYRDLRDHAVSLARILLGQGLCPGDRVALIAETGVDFVTAFVACQYARLLPVPVPVPPAFGGRDAYCALLRQMVSGSRAIAMVAPSWLEDWLSQALDGMGLKFHGSIARLRHLPEAAVTLAKPRQDDVAYLQFSSGSTRTPAGIAITHRALLTNAGAMAGSGLALRPGDRAISWLPFYHDMGLVGFVLTPAIAQLSVDYLATRDFARRPLGWLSLMDRNGATISYSPSFGYELCARRASTALPQGLDLSRWRAAGIGGDMIRPQVLDEFADIFAPAGFDRCAFVPSYGMAETTLAVSFADLNRGMEIDRVDVEVLEHQRRAEPPVLGANGRTRDFVVCGRVLPGHELQIRDHDGLPLGERRVGLVMVRGPSLMRGYDGRPDETARVMDPDGWLDTGDLGYLAEGRLVITGRAKDVIIVNGRNIWPHDIEHTVEQLETLRTGDAAVFAIDDARSERAVVLVQCRTGDAAARLALAHAVGAAVSRVHGIEPQVVLVANNALPQTSSGKLSRSAARAAFLAGDFTSGGAA
mgnify:CR=1 FL=1